MNRPTRLAVALLLGAALAGCTGSPKSSTEPAPLQDAILIATITPAVGTVLKVGQTVTFQAGVNYRLISGNSGTVTLAIEDPGGTILPNGLATVNVVNGEASVNLTTTVLIPSGINLVQVIASVNSAANPNQVTQANINYQVTT